MWTRAVGGTPLRLAMLLSSLLRVSPMSCRAEAVQSLIRVVHASKDSTSPLWHYANHKKVKDNSNSNHNNDQAQLFVRQASWLIKTRCNGLGNGHDAEGSDDKRGRYCWLKFDTGCLGNSPVTRGSPRCPKASRDSLTCQTVLSPFVTNNPELGGFCFDFDISAKMKLEK